MKSDCFKRHEDEAHATADQGAQIVRVLPVQTVEAGLGGQEDCARHPARAAGSAAIFRNWPLTAQTAPARKGTRHSADADLRNAGADVGAVEREIDQSVYALYGLKPEEIHIVEGAAK